MIARDAGRLSAAEAELLALARAGRTPAQIAAELGVSRQAVSTRLATERMRAALAGVPVPPRMIGRPSRNEVHTLVRDEPGVMTLRVFAGGRRR
jgi:hypothetical protein